MKPVFLSRRRVGFPLQARIRAFDFRHLHMQPASEFKDSFVDSLQVGGRLTYNGARPETLVIGSKVAQHSDTV